MIQMMQGYAVLFAGDMLERLTCAPPPNKEPSLGGETFVSLFIIMIMIIIMT